MTAVQSRLTENFAPGEALVPATAGGGDDRGGKPEGMVNFVYDNTTVRWTHAIPTRIGQLRSFSIRRGHRHYRPAFSE